MSIHPAEVRTKEKVGKGKIELVPLTDMKGVVAKKTPQAVHKVQIDDDVLFVQEPSRPRTTKVADWKAEMIIAHFWWVGTTANVDEADMIEKKVQCDGVHYTVYTNSKCISAHEKLLIYKPKKEVAPLGSASSASRKRPRT